MKLVIDIPDELYNSVLNETYCGSLYEELKNGIVLPKGHGDLIDRKELEMFGSWQMQIIPEGNGKYVETKIYTQRAVDTMPTIIPADKEESGIV